MVTTYITDVDRELNKYMGRNTIKNKPAKIIWMFTKKILYFQMSHLIDCVTYY